MITIVGIGALGSHLVNCVRNCGPITVIDFDRVEQKNVLSQFHTKPGVGKHKTMALQQLMNFMYALKIEVKQVELREDNATTILKSADVLVDCLDNAKARRILQEYAHRFEVPCLHGGLAADGALGRVLWDETFTIEDGDGAATCEGGEHLPFINLVSSYMAVCLQTFLKTGKKNGYIILPGGGANKVT